MALNVKNAQYYYILQSFYWKDENILCWFFFQTAIFKYILVPENY